MYESDDDGGSGVEGLPKMIHTVNATDQSQYVESCFEYYLIGLETSDGKCAIEIYINVVEAIKCFCVHKVQYTQM